ncbi:type VI secretion system membrane subunit TssM [Methylocella silvestris]|uniref:Type VI secretion system membrane subunit TssM n=1 Tax=Methylocella silvestris TaxID=199596 RepID=A0A2J7TI45_METSI|nr:type VI secretion system membrane subunit TssM [Methylocella silvestris]PNG26426.1 type VI secretion system membrane subunit TssM [Methylocella silvestris]
MNRKFWLRLSISVIGALALGALIWLAAPLIPLQGAHPLEEPLPRAALIAVIFALIGGAGLYRFNRRRKGAARIAQSLTADGFAAEDSDAPVLAERMKEALSVLRGRGGRANYLYDLPWYVLIGPPGSGKTTALINSGLEFPLAGGVKPGAVKGVGGTRYCDWWFTEDAVLIDTAGRYTTQDSDARADQKSWLAFLDLLKKNRPRQPINGVLVAISLEDILTLPADEVAAHAAAIRSRLVELHQRLKVDFPVYAVFTKADLLIGFMEFFGDLDEAGRRQVWGATFATMDKGKSMLAEAPFEFKALLDPLSRIAQNRLDEEKDPATRVLAFGFPAQMAALQGPVIGFLDAIFDPARYKIRAALRGFYFTSGTQQGTPIDQLLGALAKGFGAEAVGTPVYSGQGKSFFLTDLIKKVVIGEAGWVSTGRGNRIVKMAAFASLIIAAPLLIGAWWVSYARNVDRISQTVEAAQKYPAASRGVGEADVVSDRDLAKALPALHALRYLPGGYADSDAEQISGGLGLNQTARLRSAAASAYGVGLERMLRPRLVYRLEEQIEASANDPANLFDALKVYLMLGGLETVDRQLLVNWMQRDWSETLYPGPKNSEGRKELEQHLLAMLDLETGHGAFVQLNGPLVEKAQAALARETVADRALRIMAARARALLRADWSAAKVGGAGALLVFEPSIEAISVPYFLTRSGYEGFVKALPSVVEEMARDRWVLGAAGETVEISAQYDHLRENLVDAYAKSFIDAWREAIGKLKIRKLTVERPSYPLLTAASSVTSPFIRLLESIRDETQLSTSDGDAPTKSASVEGEAMAVVGADGKTPAQMIEAALAPYHKLVEGDPGQRPIDRTLSELNEIRVNLSRLATNAPSGEIAERIESGVGRLKTNAAALPPPFAGMMEQTASDILREVTLSAVARTVAKLREQVTFTCQEKIGGRYPFAKDAERDVELDDFVRMFGPKGLIDQFFGSYVVAFADTSGPQWKWRDGSPLAKEFAPSALADFKIAADIRAAFFGSDPSAPAFSYTVTPPPVSGVRLEIDATLITGSQGATAVQWPGSAENHRTLLTMRSNAARPPMLLQSGVWSVYRLLDTAKLNADGTQATFNLGGRDLAFRFVSTPANPAAGMRPLNIAQLRAFHCPGGS